MDYITIYDYLLLPVYLFAFYFLLTIKSKKYEGTHLKKNFITAFFLHMGGSVLYCLVIQYYYGYGDSFGFFQGSDFIRKVISVTGDPFSPFFMSSGDFEKLYAVANPGDYSFPVGIDVVSNLTVMKISAALSYLSFNSYLIISLFFGLFAFTGLWKLFKTLNEITEKKGERLLAFAVLYTPSVCFWGSGLIKDSICLGAISFIIYYGYKIFIKKKFRFRDPFLLLVLFYLLFIIKSYLVSGLLISAVLAYVIHIIVRSKKSFFKLMIVSFILLVSATIVIISLSSTIDSIVEDSKTNIETFKGAYANLDEEDNGSGFYNADIDISIPGIILRSPLAVFTTLFRPFLWEVRKPIMALSALESFLALLATIFVLIKCRVLKFFYYIFTDPYIFFAFIFSAILAVIIGLSTFNFGTMVRYRLPVLPFYFFMLLSIYLKNKEALNGNDNVTA
jgi:hypothetical protein